MSFTRFFSYNLNISNGSIIANNNTNTVGSLFTTGGNVGIGTTSPTNRLHVNGNSSLLGNVTIGSDLIVTGPTLQIPTGNIAARPGAPQAGSIRYNTETSQFEGYGPGGAWGSLGGVVDIAQTTKILASGSPSTTDGNLYFFTVGTERMRIASTGNIGIGTTSPNFNLDIIGDLRVTSNLTTGAVYSTNITTTNLVATNFTASNFLANNINYGVSSIFSGSFSANNNVVVPSNIIGFNFNNANTRSFQATVTVSILRSSGGNLYQNHIIDGFQTDAGWNLYTSNVGDETGIEFYITPQGQIQYTSINTNNFVSNTIRFSVIQISNTGNYSFSGNLTQGTLLIDSIQIQNTRNSIVGTDPGSFQVLGGSTFSKGINILTTENAVGLGTGGCLSVLGGTSISKDLFVGGTITVGNLEVNGLTDTLNLTVTNSTVANLNSTNITSSNILCTTFSGSNLNLSGNLNVAGTLTVVNITTTNLVDTNITAGIARITTSLVATGNSNTLGNIFTTGGNVGISNTAPSYALDVSGNLRINNNGFDTIGPTLRLIRFADNIGAAIWQSYYPSISEDVLAFAISNGSNPASLSNVKMMLTGSGRLGIGTTNPGYTLDVAGGVRCQSTTFVAGSGSDSGFRTGWNGIAPGMGGSDFYNYRGLGVGGFYFKVLNMSNQDVGWAPISAGGYTNASDMRIKKNISQIDSQQAITIIRKLRPISYNMKDNHDDQTLKYGFVAQEIEESIPTAVKKSPSILPNFQKYVTYHHNYLLNIHNYKLNIPSHGLINGDKIRINFNDLDGDHDVTIKTIDNDHFAFEHTHQTSSETIFLYGSQVHDFRTLDYNMVHTILHSATQNIDNRVQQLELENAILHQKIQDLEQLINKLM